MSRAAPAHAVGDAFFAAPPGEVAARLVGCTLHVGDVGGVIVETEAYSEDDPASHSHRGPTPRCRSMFGPPGTLYVYRSHGIHWCLNLVTEAAGRGSAVLIRAIEPTHGLDIMRSRRGDVPDRALCSGPGRLTQALGVHGGMDGLRARDAGVEVRPGRLSPDVDAVARIGVSRGADLPRRMVARGSEWLSRPARTVVSA